MQPAMDSFFTPSPPPQLPHLEDGEGDGPRVSPLSTAVLVKNPAGALVRLEGEVRPHPQHAALDIVSVKDGTAVLRAIVAEPLARGEGFGEETVASVRLETKAKNIPIAILDTSRAVFPEGAQAPPASQRRVVLHRVGGDDGSVAGPACAWIVKAGRAKFVVHYLVGEPGVALTVNMASKDDIDYIVDLHGQVVAKAEPLRNPGSAPGQVALWVKQGMDLALVSSVAIAVKKLGSE